MFLLLGNIGGTELILILSVILIFFGAKRIPELARGLGKGIREFKDASSGVRREIEEGINTKPKNPKKGVLEHLSTVIGPSARVEGWKPVLRRCGAGIPQTNS